MKVEILFSKNGEKIIKGDNIYLCSRYNPINEANVLIDSYKHVLDDEIIHVVGLGAAYHIKELLRRINGTQIIKVYEEERAIYNFIKDDLKDELQSGKVNIYFRNELNSFISTINESKDIVIHRPSMKLMKDKHVKDLFERFIISKDSINKFSDIMHINEDVNVKKGYIHIEKFLENIDSKIVMVVAAGPSLDNLVGKIKEHRDNYKIYAVGAALRTLMESGIVPDLIIITDPQEVVLKQLKGYENSDVPLAFLSTASRWAVEAYNGPKYIFYNKKNNGNMIINTGKTVAVSAIDLAIKSKCEKVILVGQDLAYLHNKTHANSYESIYGIEDKVYINDKTEYVRGVNGKMLTTTKAYLIFKNNIEKLIRTHKQIDFYNCSLGAEIEGTIASQIDLVLKECLD